MFKIKPRGTKICPTCSQGKLNESEYSFLNSSNPFGNGQFVPKKKSTKVVTLQKPFHSMSGGSKISSLF